MKKISLIITLIIVTLFNSTGCYYQAINNCFQEIKAISEPGNEDVNINAYSESVDDVITNNSSGETECPLNADSEIEYEDPYIAIESALEKRESSVTLLVDQDFHLTWSDLYAMYYGSFWLETYIAFPAYRENGHLYKYFYFTYYDISEDEFNSMRQEIDTVTNEIISRTPTTSEYDAALFVHDELVKRITYDKTLEKPHTHDLYGALVLRSAVCTAYSSAYCHILRELGIETQIVESESHSWNKIGDTYVDVTWDDLDLVSVNTKEAIVSHYWFGISHEQLKDEDHLIVSYSYNSEFNEFTLPNYLKTEGYLIDSFDFDTVKEIFSKQLSKGETYITVGFTNSEAYSKFVKKIGSNIWPILREVGVKADYLEYWQEEEYMTFSFVLSKTIELN